MDPTSLAFFPQSLTAMPLGYRLLIDSAESGNNLSDDASPPSRSFLINSHKIRYLGISLAQNSGTFIIDKHKIFKIYYPRKFDSIIIVNSQWQNYV